MSARDRLKRLDHGTTSEEWQIIGRLYDHRFDIPVKLAFGTRPYREAQEEILEKQRCLGAALRG